MKPSPLLVQCDGCGIAIQKVRGSSHPQGLAEHECKRVSTIEETQRRVLAILVERANDSPLADVAKLLDVLTKTQEGSGGDGVLLEDARAFLRRDA